jgi:hypothetical protein
MTQEWLNERLIIAHRDELARQFRGTRRRTSRTRTPIIRRYIG